MIRVESLVPFEDRSNDGYSQEHSIFRERKITFNLFSNLLKPYRMKSPTFGGARPVPAKENRVQCIL